MPREHRRPKVKKWKDAELSFGCVGTTGNEPEVEILADRGRHIVHARFGANKDGSLGTLSTCYRVRYYEELYLGSWRRKEDDFFYANSSSHTWVRDAKFRARMIEAAERFIAANPEEWLEHVAGAMELVR